MQSKIEQHGYSVVAFQHQMISVSRFSYFPFGDGLS